MKWERSDGSVALMGLVNFTAVSLSLSLDRPLEAYRAAEVSDTAGNQSNNSRTNTNHREASGAVVAARRSRSRRGRASAMMVTPGEGGTKEQSR